MAPKRISLRPTARNKARFVSLAWAGILRSRSENKSLRRLKNGLLDVSRKSAGYLDAITSNSRSPLLKLPPEVRNRIWENALGGRTFDIEYTEKMCKNRRYMLQKTAVSEDTFPDHCLALLQVCRQVYTETALLPFSENTFRFSRAESFEWARKLLKVQRNLLQEVHIVTHRAERLYDWVGGGQAGESAYLPEVFPVDIFPNLKHVVVEIRRSAFHDFEAGGPKWTSKQYRTRVTAKMTDFISYIREAKPHAHVSFRYTNLSLSACGTGLTDSECSDEEQTDDVDTDMVDSEISDDE